VADARAPARHVDVRPLTLAFTMMDLFASFRRLGQFKIVRIPCTCAHIGKVRAKLARLRVTYEAVARLYI
jgi:hypothetical protein